MKILAFVCVLLALSSSITFTQTQTQPKPKHKTQNAPTGKEKSTTPKEKTKATGTNEFPALIAEYYKAWNTLNLDLPGKYYAKDADLVFYDVAPMQYKGWAEYKTGVQKLLQGFSSFKLIPHDDLKVTRRGKIAWTTMTFRISGKQKDGKAMELECRHTAIWEKWKSDWLVVHEHISAPIPQ